MKKPWENSEKTSRTFQANRFIHRLRKSVTRKIFVLIFLGIILFTAGFYMMSWARNTIRAQENLDMLKNTYYMLYNQSREFLNADETVEAFGEKWKDPASMRFSYAFNRFNNASIISNRFILTDTEGKLMESDFSEEELSDYLLNYNRAVCYNAGNQ